MAKAGVFINVVGTLDAKALQQAQEELGKLGQAAEGAGKTMSEKLGAAGDKMSGVGKKLSLGLTAPLVAVGALAFNAASDLNESMSKVNVVFGESADEIKEWSTTAAKSLGISRNEALAAVGTFGNLFSAMEIGQPAAKDMSTQLVGLASDLGSFNNANPTEVLEALRSGLTGETEPLKRFGVNINQARIEAEAFALGLVQPVKNAPQIQAAHLAVEKATLELAKAQKEHGKESLEARDASSKLELAQQKLSDVTAGSIPELDAAQKAQATYSLIMKDSALAQGDFARTSEGAANQQRILAAQFKDAAAQLGTQLLPIGQKVLGFLSGLFEKFSGLSSGTQTFILAVAGIAAALGPLLVVIGNVTKVIGFLASETVIAAAKQVIAWGSTAASAVASAASHVAQVGVMVAKWVFLGAQSLLHAAKVAAAWLIAMGPIALVIAAVVGLVVAIIKNWDTIKEVTLAIWGAIRDFLSGVWEGIKAVAVTVFDFLKNLFLNFTPIGQIIQHWDEIKNFLSGLWDNIKQKAGVVFDFLKNLFLNFTPIGQIIQHWDTIKEKLSAAWDWLKDKFTTVWDGIKSTFTGAVNFIIGIANRMIGSWERLINLFVEGLNKAADLANKVLPGNPIPKVGTVSLPRIPSLAAGGLARTAGVALVGEAGPELVRLPKGAAVAPLRGGGGAGGVTVVVHVEGSLVHERDLVEVLRSEFLQLSRRGLRPLEGVA